jgi:outer membrane protein insertion porin family
VRRLLLSAALALVACGDPPATTAPAKVPAAAHAKDLCPARVDKHDDDVAKAEALAGRPVSQVCVIGVSEETLRAVVDALVTKQGEKLDVARVHDELTTIAKNPMVDDAAAYAVAHGADVVLVYELVERSRVAEVVFEGAHALGKEFEGKVPLVENRPFVRAEAHLLAGLLREEYARRGYGGAKVSTRSEPTKPGYVRVTIVVDEGVVWKLGAARFEGAKKIAEAELTKVADLGAAYDPARVERAALLVTRLYYDRGMVHARVKPAVLGKPAADGTVIPTFEITEGDVFKVSGIKVANASKDDEKAFRKMLETKAKQVFSRGRVEDDVKRVREYYSKKGRAVIVTPVTKLDIPTHTIDLTLEITDASKAAP